MNQIFASKLIPLINDWKPDIIYMRLGVYNYAWEWLSKYYPLVIEVNTDNLHESLVNKKYPIYLFHLLTLKRLLNKVHGIVFVTSELKERFKKYQIPKTVISNGINLNEIKPLPNLKENSLQLTFIASDPCSWHGIDKIERLARFFPNWHFNLVGNFPVHFLASNISKYNRLSSSDYVQLLSNSSVALGTLALHRKNMNEACPLKVREYLAYGLPTIIGYEDTDFTPPPPFILQIPNTENNVIESLPLIQNFVQKWQGKRVERDAIQHIDISIKEQQRIAFFEQVINNIYANNES